ncbi:metal-dependent hydrolase [Mycobacterium sp. CVI_P3]|uniref:Metal-dependent hydrolase n=1 Tax=Mycobacterium pinniadriaticum TaxID=2994102 RepID=A0ABT3SKV9_9MYCO|nr:metal-dependent hydrolase [Mycobacterium pinniadriaticum]MCX2933580.1 metal-dependent hydrolase [Mycobacterium pinniadriaticum]MCX2940002.1 metal-dependent hydrolase [Mycobacterium pinniadriaticum]
MTDLQVRKMRFGFADSPVPFIWNQSDPAFSCAANMLSFLFLAIEKMISATVHEAMPLIADPQVAEEALAFVRQEGQHSMAHRQHAKELIKAYPALQETLNEVMSVYDDLTATAPLKYRLAYIADLEATFTPTFTMMLNNADTLFAPGDDRVASLFVWHFVEEMEHRSSALMIYDSIVANPWYRMRMAPSVFQHGGAVMVKAASSFNKLIPLEERNVDATSIFGSELWKVWLTRKFSFLRKYRFFALPDDGPIQRLYSQIPLREQAAVAFGVMRSQVPGHNPAKQEMPRLAKEWLARYDAGHDVSRWYTSGNQRRQGQHD